MVLGDSTITIPTFKSLHPDFRCDVIFIDGGHAYEVALADIRNMASLAGPDRWVVVDDTGYTSVESAFTTAMEEGVIDKESKRYYQDFCRQASWGNRDHHWLKFLGGWSGFTIAKYNSTTA